MSSVVLLDAEGSAPHFNIVQRDTHQCHVGSPEWGRARSRKTARHETIQVKYTNQMFL